MILSYKTHKHQYIFEKCLLCGRNLHGHGTRKRHVRVGGNKIWYRIRRFRCPVCKKTFTLLEPCMIPYKHYAAVEIEDALKDIAAGVPFSQNSCVAEESTLRRWKRDFFSVIQEFIGQLLSLTALDIMPKLDIFQRLISLLTLLETHIFTPLPVEWCNLVKLYYYISNPVCLSSPP